MYQTGKIIFKVFSDGRGDLSAIEGGTDIPFDIRRVYYITDVKEGVERGRHSHKKLHQVLICLNGEVKVRVFNGTQHETICLNRPNEGLYIGPMVWREMYDFSDQAVLMVLASQIYDEEDYTRDFDDYLEEVKAIFGGDAVL